MVPPLPPRWGTELDEGCQEMRAIVTCECCGHRQAVARPIRRPEAFHMVCHQCEGVLRVEVTPDDLRGAQRSLGRSRTARV